MALESLDNLKNALDIQEIKDKKGSLYDLIKELQGLKITVVAGAAADTNIAISGIKTEDTLLAVLEIQPPTAASGDTIKGDRTSEASITSDGNIQLTTTDTTGNQLLVVWWDKK